MHWRNFILLSLTLVLPEINSPFFLKLEILTGVDYENVIIELTNNTIDMIFYNWVASYCNILSMEICEVEWDYFPLVQKEDKF